MSVERDGWMHDEYTPTNHVFMSKDDAEAMAEYERTTKLRKTRALPIHDHHGAWCVLVYDKSNHPSHVMLLDFGEE